LDQWFHNITSDITAGRNKSVSRWCQSRYSLRDSIDPNWKLLVYPALDILLGLAFTLGGLFQLGRSLGKKVM